MVHLRKCRMPFFCIYGHELTVLLFRSLQYERDTCERMIGRLNIAKQTTNKLLEYLTTCLAEINNAINVAYEVEKSNMQSEHKKQVDEIERNQQNEQNKSGETELEFRMVDQKYQYTGWPEWTREEQINNSFGVEEKSVKTGRYIPGCVFLQLKPK